MEHLLRGLIINTLNDLSLLCIIILAEIFFLLIALVSLFVSRCM